MPIYLSIDIGTKNFASVFIEVVVERSRVSKLVIDEAVVYDFIPGENAKKVSMEYIIEQAYPYLSNLRLQCKLRRVDTVLIEKQPTPGKFTQKTAFLSYAVFALFTGYHQWSTHMVSPKGKLFLSTDLGDWWNPRDYHPRRGGGLKQIAVEKQFGRLSRKRDWDGTFNGAYFSDYLDNRLVFRQSPGTEASQRPETAAVLKRRRKNVAVYLCYEILGKAGVACTSLRVASKRDDIADAILQCIAWDQANPKAGNIQARFGREDAIHIEHLCFGDDPSLSAEREQFFENQNMEAACFLEELSSANRLFKK